MRISGKIVCNAVLLIFISAGMLHSESDGEKAGVIKQIDKKKGEIFVGSIKSVNDVQMGDLLYVRIDGKVVQLRVEFPMQTMAKCRAAGENRELWTKIENGMQVYRYNKSVVDRAAAGKDIQSRNRGGSGYKIGDRGPGGGWIFYDKGDSKGGWRYLEAAAEDQALDAMWYNGVVVQIGATGREIGTGKSNTAKIIKIQGKGYYAARLCVDYRGGGKSDWFLPSKDELDAMYVNLKKSGLVDFSGRFCWTSTEDDAEKAYFQAFMFGYTNSTVKTDAGRVRAVRAF